MERYFWFSRSLRAAERGHSHNSNNLIGYQRFHMLLFLLSMRSSTLPPHSPIFVITPIALYTTSSSHKLSMCPLRLSPHPHGFLPILIIITRRTAHCQPQQIHHDHSINIYGEERAVRRLNIILSLEEGYITATGQPIGFDLSRINCDVAKEVVTVNDSTLDGWEFNILTANIDSHKKTNLAPHLLSYLVVVAVFQAHPTRSDSPISIPSAPYILKVRNSNTSNVNYLTHESTEYSARNSCFPNSRFATSLLAFRKSHMKRQSVYINGAS